MRSKIQKVQFRRKREGKTNYYKRLKLLKAGKERLVVRPTKKNMIVQAVSYAPEGDKVVVCAATGALGKHGWKTNKGNIPSAYLVGFLAGRIMLNRGIKQLILDTGLYRPVKGGKIYACVKGVIDAGIDVPISEEMFPDQERINGGHIASYSSKIKDKMVGYKKNGVEPSKIKEMFDAVKRSIEAEK